jgi:hypothetical protein
MLDTVTPFLSSCFARIFTGKLMQAVVRIDSRHKASLAVLDCLFLVCLLELCSLGERAQERKVLRAHRNVEC